MEIKKSKEADLERERTSFVLLGLLISFSSIFIAFEWSQTDVQKIDLSDATAIVQTEEELAPQSQQVTPPPPPPMAPPEVQPQVMNFVRNEQAVNTNIKVQGEDDHQVVAPVAPIQNIVQKVQEEEVDNKIYTHVDKKAEYPGGQAALMSYLSNNIHYPNAAREAGIQGLVILQFTVNSDGSIENIDVMRSPDASLEKEAIRVVKSMPRWHPGENNHKKVRSTFKLPVNFRLG